MFWHPLSFFWIQLPEFLCPVDLSSYLSPGVLMSLQLWLLGQDCWQNWHWLQGWPSESKARARHRGRDLQLLRNSKTGKNRGWQKECLHGKVSLCPVCCAFPGSMFNNLERKKKKKAFFTLKLHSWRYFLPGNALPGTGWPVIEILALRWSVIQCICCF